MASQAFQTNLRLLGIVAVALLSQSCARDLKNDSEIEPLPVAFQAQMKPADVPTEEAKTPVAIHDGSPAVASNNPGTPTPPVPEAKKMKKSRIAKVEGFVPASWPFGIGEVLKIRLSYGVIEGGVATMKVLDAQELNGEKLIHIGGDIVSSRMVNLFYKVDNSFDDYLTLKNFLPVRQVIRQNESSRWGQSILNFDYKKNTAHYYQNLERYKKSRVLIDKQIEPAKYAQDIFGGLYFYRFLAPGENYYFTIHDKTKSWNTSFDFIGREEISVPAGKFKAFHYQIVPQLGGYLTAKAKVDVWFSDDERRVILRFRSKLKFGSLSGELAEYTPGVKILLTPPELLTPFKPIAKAP